MGPNPLPEMCAQYIEEWKLAYNDYTVQLWTDVDVVEHDLISPQLKNLYGDVNMPHAFKADILRYVIINKFGGIYLDTDFQFLRRIPDEFFQYDFLGGIQNNGQIAIGFFGAIPNTELLNEVIEKLPHNFEHSKNVGWYNSKCVNNISGPDFFDSIAKKYCTNNRYAFFDNKYLYPYSWLEPHRRSEDFYVTHPLAYAVHHWYKSWL